MASTKVTLGGVPLSFRRGETHAWTLQAGTRPAKRVFQLTKFRADKIFKLGDKQIRAGVESTEVIKGPLTLEITPTTARVIKIEGLYVISPKAGDDQLNTGGVLIADVRYYWPRRLIVKSYNVRKRTDQRRVVGSGADAIQVRQRVRDVIYRPESLRDDGAKWTARQILVDVLTDLFGGATAKFDVPTDLQFPEEVEGIELNDPGDQALARVLKFLPGTDVFVDEKGITRVFCVLDGSEERVIRELPSPFHQAGSLRKIDRSLMRPARVRAYFEREVELRFDYFEDAEEDPDAGLTTSVRGARNREPLRLDNVLPVPDQSLTLTDGTTVTKGTWIPIQEYIDAVRALDDAPAPVKAGGFLPFTLETIQRTWIKDFQFLYLVYAMVAGQGEPDRVWSRRINALAQHYRSTFRIRDAWGNKIKTIRAERVSVVDSETRQRARSQAFMDYFMKPSFRSIIKTPTDYQFVGWNVEGYAELIDDARPAPFEVNVVDPVNLIFRVTPKIDPYGVSAAVKPGQFGGTIPVTTAARTTGPGTAAVQRATFEQPLINPETFRMAVVMTAVQAIPNGTGRYHQVDVTPAQAGQTLRLTRPPTSNKGPAWDVGIGGGLETARFAWRDEQAQRIREAFFDGRTPPAELHINPDTVGAIARAQAARVYAPLLDRFEGVVVGPSVPGVRPTGAIKAVTYSVKDGVVAMTITCPPVSQSPSIMSLLPESVRKVVFGLVQQ